MTTSNFSALVEVQADPALVGFTLLVGQDIPKFAVLQQLRLTTDYRIQNHADQSIAIVSSSLEFFL